MVLAALKECMELEASATSLDWGSCRCPANQITWTILTFNSISFAVSECSIQSGSSINATPCSKSKSAQPANDRSRGRVESERIRQPRRARVVLRGSECREGTYIYHLMPHTASVLNLHRSTANTRRRSSVIAEAMSCHDHANTSSAGSRHMTGVPRAVG